jgi:hypothetical protein
MSNPPYARPATPTQPADFDKALDFVFGIAANPVTLTAITPDGPVETKTFRKSDAGRLAAFTWLTVQNTSRNIYYQDCSVGTLNKRPRKADVTHLHAMHVDLDVKGPPASAVAEKAEMLARLEGYTPAPTHIVDTGNGLQGLWVLDAPHAATPQTVARIERINRRIAADLGGDSSCHDVAHLLRLPFTVNHPNRKKIEAGRTKVLAHVVYAYDDAMFACALSNFAAIEARADAARQTQASELDPIEIPASVDLSRLGTEFHDLIVNGPAEGVKYGDGSRSAYSALTTARRARLRRRSGIPCSVISNYANAARTVVRASRGPIAVGFFVVSARSVGLVIERTRYVHCPFNPITRLHNMLCGERLPASIAQSRST